MDSKPLHRKEGTGYRMAKSGKGSVEARSLSGAERHQRATGRLSEARQQLAEIEQQLADGARQLETLAAMEQSAAKDVERAERQADTAAAALVDSQAQMLIADGTPEEAAAKEHHGELAQAHTAARQALDEARATLATVRERSQNERAAVGARMDEAKAQRRDVARLVQSLERAVSDAYEQMGHETFAELAAEHHKLMAQYDTARQTVDQVAQSRAEHRQQVIEALSAWPDLQAMAKDAGYDRSPVEQAAYEAELASEAENRRQRHEAEVAEKAREEERKRRRGEELRRNLAIQAVRVAMNAHLEGEALAAHFREYGVTPITLEEVRQAQATIARRAAQDEANDQEMRQRRAGLIN